MESVGGEFDKDTYRTITEVFCPPAPPDLEPWLRQAMLCEGEVVDLDGLRLPRTREPSLSFECVDRATWRAIGTTTAQPGRNIRLCAEAAYLLDIEGRSALSTRDYLGLGDHGEVVSRPFDEPDKIRFRSVARVANTGRGTWSALGAWPWAVFDGKLPFNWRQRSDAAVELALWHDESTQRALGRARHAMRTVRRAEQFVGLTRTTLSFRPGSFDAGRDSEEHGSF